MGDIDAAIPIKRTRLGVIVASTLLNPITPVVDLRYDDGNFVTGF